MKTVALAALALITAAACGTAPVADVPSPSGAGSPASSSASAIPSPSQTSAGGSVSPSPSPPSPSPPPGPTVTCKTGSSAASLFLMGSGTASELLYDVSDPIHPRLLCTIANTSAHLFTGDTFVYLKPVSATETDIVLHSLGSGNESVAGRFPFRVAAGAWTPDGSLMVYLGSIGANPSGFSSQSVWLFSQQKSSLLYSYPLGIGDCICRFGLGPAVLAISPDGEYLVAGESRAGKGSQPLAVLRLSDGKVVLTAGADVVNAIWSRAGHRLYLFRGGGPSAESWTPEGGLVQLNAVSWSELPGVSPDGAQVAYTSYDDGGTPPAVPPRVYVYTIASGATRMLLDQPRTQALFVKDAWVWYLDEGPCTDSCAGLTAPTGKVFAMNLSTGVEQTVSFASGEAPLAQPYAYWPVFSPGEFWPNS